ncbi:class I tRNA ligase family protein, partial [Dehalococcoidia bacterium]|nr:class I tRNA ligase family protein [Dehalococcoidia bacterium]
KELRRMTHKTIKKVNEDLERFHFNTMLAALMEFSNYLARVKETSAVEGSPAWREAIDSLLLLLAPALPHLAEELWERTGHAYSIHHQPFPAWREELVAEEEFTLVIQINGKVRDKVSVPISISEDEARKLALSRGRIKAQLGDRRIVRVIYVAGRLVNIVVK